MKNYISLKAYAGCATNKTLGKHELYVKINEIYVYQVLIIVYFFSCDNNYCRVFMFIIVQNLLFYFLGRGISERCSGIWLPSRRGISPSARFNHGSFSADHNEAAVENFAEALGYEKRIDLWRWCVVFFFFAHFTCCSNYNNSMLMSFHMSHLLTLCSITLVAPNPNPNPTGLGQVAHANHFAFVKIWMHAKEVMPMCRRTKF